MGATGFSIAIALASLQRMKKKRGRPRKRVTILTDPVKFKKAHGRPKGSYKYTPAVLQQFRRHIDDLRNEMARSEDGRKVSIRAALRADMYRHYKSLGLSHLRATILVKKNLPRLKTILSRRT